MESNQASHLGIDSHQLSVAVRRDVLKMVYNARASHVGSCLSMADIISVLYANIMNINVGCPESPHRDRFVLSKGHAAAVVYATLANIGIIPKNDLETYGDDYSHYMTHVSHKIRGVEFSSGSLGHGLPYGVGKSLAAKRLGLPWRVFVVLSDGEMDEGSNWEAIMFANHHKLDNITAIIDYNKLQSLTEVSKTISLEPLVEKIQAFGWAVRRVNGHDHDELRQALSTIPWEKGKPSMLVADTVKGKGVCFMENKVEWHYRSPTKELLDQALQEIGGQYA